MSQALVKLNTGDLAALTPHLALGPEAAAAIAGLHAGHRSAGPAGRRRVPDRSDPAGRARAAEARGGMVGVHVRRSHRAGRPAGGGPRGARGGRGLGAPADRPLAPHRLGSRAGRPAAARPRPGRRSPRSGAAIRCRRRASPPSRRRRILPALPPPARWRLPRFAATLRGGKKDCAGSSKVGVISPRAAPAGCLPRRHDATNRRPACNAADTMQLTMTVLRCPDSVAPETRNVAGGEFSVGRGPGVDWVLPDPERLLSKRHFAVAFRGGVWQLADTSTNGTFLNREGDPIGAGDVRSLRDGDRLRAWRLRNRGAAGRGGGGARPRVRAAAPSPIRSPWIRSVPPGRNAIRSTNRIIRACASGPRRRSCRTISIRWRRSRAKRRSAVPPRRTIRR